MNGPWSRALVLLVSLASVAACGSSSASAPPVFDAAFADSTAPLSAEASVDRYGDSPSCNSVMNVAAPIAYGFSRLAPPTETGGPVSDGTFVTTDAVIYSSAFADAGFLTSVALTLEVSGSTWQLSATDAGEPSSSVTASFTFDGTSFTLREGCPADVLLLSGTFTATNEQITLASTGQSGVAGTTVVTFTRQ